MTEARSLIEVAQERVGIVRAAWVLAFMVEWHRASVESDEWPTGLSEQVVAFAAWSRRSERTVWREIKRFRDVWPKEQSPSRLMALAARTWDVSHGAAGLGSVRLAA